MQLKHYHNQNNRHFTSRARTSSVYHARAIIDQFLQSPPVPTTKHDCKEGSSKYKDLKVQAVLKENLESWTETTTRLTEEHRLLMAYAQQSCKEESTLLLGSIARAILKKIYEEVLEEPHTGHSCPTPDYMVQALTVMTVFLDEEDGTRKFQKYCSLVGREAQAMWRKSRAELVLEKLLFARHSPAHPELSHENVTRTLQNMEEGETKQILQQLVQTFLL